MWSSVEESRQFAPQAPGRPGASPRDSAPTTNQAKEIKNTVLILQLMLAWLVYFITIIIVLVMLFAVLLILFCLVGAFRIPEMHTQVLWVLASLSHLCVDAAS